MGIRFACHVCSKKLNIKQELAGRRGICPACSAKFRIPLVDTEKSTPVDSSAIGAETRPTNGHAPAQQAAAEPTSQAGGQMIDLIEDEPTMTWYVRPPSGGQYGPASGDVLRQWISEGRVAATSLLWREGWPQWREAKDALPELAGRLPEPSGADNKMASANRATSREADEFGLGDELDTGRRQQAISPRKVSAASTVSAGSSPNASDAMNAANSVSAASAVSTIDAVTTANPSANFTGRSDTGSDRRNRSDRRTLTIVGLTGVAICLVFALAFVLSR